MENIVDLHMHSSYSDGTVTPVDMIKMMNDLGVDYASITDHDNIKAYEDIRNAKFDLNKPITIIPATELGCSFDGVIRDVLGYGIDTKVIDEFVSERYSPEAKLEKQKRLLNEYKRELEINGVGYRAQKKGNKLVMNLGYSHPVEMDPPEGITFDVPDANHIIVRGIDKEVVGQTAAVVRTKRPPEVYRGKGIKYAEEHIRRKEGKAGKK